MTQLEERVVILTTILDQYLVKDEVQDYTNPEHWISLSNFGLKVSTTQLEQLCEELVKADIIKIANKSLGPVTHQGVGIVYDEAQWPVLDKDNLYIDLVVTDIEALNNKLGTLREKLESNTDKVEAIEKYRAEPVIEVGDFTVYSDDTVSYKGELVKIGTQLETILSVLLTHEGTLTNYSDFDDLVQGKDGPLTPQNKRRRIYDLKKACKESYDYDLQIENLKDRGWILKVR